MGLVIGVASGAHGNTPAGVGQPARQPGIDSTATRGLLRAGGYDINSKGPDGLSIFVKLSKSFGRTFVFGTQLPKPEVVDPNEVLVVVADALSTDETAQLAQWARNGGTVVAIGYGMYSGDESGPRSLGSTQQQRGRCTIDALAGITTANFSGVLPYQQTNILIAPEVCFAGPKRSDHSSTSFVQSFDVEQGRVITIASIVPFLNRAIATDDNAALVTALVAPTRTTKIHLIGTTFTTNSKSNSGQSKDKGKSKGNSNGQDDRSLLDLISPGIKQGFLQLIVAFLLYAAWRSRRVGRPTREPLPISINARDITTARGALLAKSKRPANAATRLLDRSVADVVRRTGLPAAHIFSRLRSDGLPEASSVDTDVKLASFASELRRPRDWSAGVDATNQNIVNATISGENV